ncbi:MAG TPA: bifunctional oligoribonuclease/PAP phosphatase NrnA [Myxococcota bacterium]|nr:bifunctional oligoribonuclease/PAP phosphatase NrnA [Myxococcota bacterium]
MTHSSELFQLLQRSRRVLLTGPEGPDGDSIGACLALQHILRGCLPELGVDVAGKVPDRYRFVPGTATMVAEPEPTYDGVVVLDGDCTRLPPSATRAFQAAGWTGLVDHHRSTDAALYTVALLDPAAESTCSIVRQLAAEWGVALDPELATQLYTGLVFDTGGFRHSNTRPATHRLAAELLEQPFDHVQATRKILHERRPQALFLLGRVLGGAQLLAGGRLIVATCPSSLQAELGAGGDDHEGIVDLLQLTTGVELAALLMEKGPKVRISMRSLGAVDVAALARRLDAGGGGHMRAAGASMPGSLGELQERIVAEMVASLPTGS